MSAEGSEIELFPLSMREAVDLALKQNLRLQEAREQLEGAEASREGELARWNARYTVESEISRGEREEFLRIAGTTSLVKRNESQSSRLRMTKEWLAPISSGGRLTGQADMEIQQQEASGTAKSHTLSPRISLSFKQPLTADGRLVESASLKTSEWTNRQAHLQFRQFQDQIIADLLLTYNNLVRIKRGTALAREDLKQTQLFIQNATAKVRLGNLAEIELMKLRVQLSLAENSVLEVEKSEKAIHESLRIQLGLPAGVTIDPTTIPVFRKNNFIFLELKKLALQNRPDIQNLKIGQETAALGISLAKSTNDPFVTLSGSYRRPGSDLDFTEARRSFLDGRQEEWNASATFVFPVFDGGLERANLKRSLASLRGTEITLRAFEEAIGQEIKNTMEEIDSIERRYHTLQSGVNVAEEVFKIDQFRFSRGQITTTDLLRSQLAMFQIKQSRNNALLDYYIAEVRLYKSAGILMEQIDTLVGVNTP